jgi:hypothetical protein
MSSTCRVAPFGNLRDQIVFADPPGLSQLITSFFASKTQGILHAPLLTFFFYPDVIEYLRQWQAAFAPLTKDFRFFKLLSSIL